jgi:hypothetical protein
MATTEPIESLSLPQQNFSPLAGFLSYLVPGLGQIVQGRIGKGLLFFFALYFLFFYGQYLGDWRNVYVYANESPATQNQSGKGRLFEMVVDRVRFFSQFWIGMAAWPAIVQHFTFHPMEDEHSWLGTYQRRPSETWQNDQLRNGDKFVDLGWMYTVIAGVLNILVIYDALAGPAYVVTAARPALTSHGKEPAPG